MTVLDTVLAGGRVIDPASGLDAIGNVGIQGGSVAAVTEGPIDGRSVIDAAGLIVAPGFIDLHSHAQTLSGRRLQACDGVTTALDLEAGRSPIEAAYAREARDGSPIHYGFSASWAVVRWQVMSGAVPTGGINDALTILGEPSWQGRATAPQLDALLAGLAADIEAGGIGIGLLMGYAPGVEPDEYLSVARLAASCSVATFTHARDLVEVTPTTPVDGATEIVRAAAETGAHAHYCHINSTSARHVDRVLDLVAGCRDAGGTVTTEAYPYGSGATAIGAAFLAPERLEGRGLRPESLTYLPTGERVADAARLDELRALDPAGLVIVDFLDEGDPTDQAILRRSLQFENAIVASDAMPLLPLSGRLDQSRWPIEGAVTHPRTAGCYARALRLWREEGTPWLEAIRRCSLLPAQVLEESCPDMRQKGRLQPGADADLVVFDPVRVTDRATYLATTVTSTGIEHVFVDGTAVVSAGELVLDARPGRPIRAEPGSAGPARPTAPGPASAT